MPRLSPEQLALRRQHILDAAERCFAREGFHRTTIQHICAESEVSAGALYLYFPSKEALIAGLCERDRLSLADELAEVGRAEDMIGTFRALGHKYMVEEPRAKSVMTLAIWAEANRNPAIAEICQQFDVAFKAAIRQLFETSRQRGQVAPGVELDHLTEMFITLVDGLLKRRAVEPDFDGAAGVELALALVAAGFRGAFNPAASDPA